MYPVFTKTRAVNHNRSKTYMTRGTKDFIELNMVILSLTLNVLEMPSCKMPN